VPLVKVRNTNFFCDTQGAFVGWKNVTGSIQDVEGIVQ
jgi:hypothetical protein